MSDILHCRAATNGCSGDAYCDCRCLRCTSSDGSSEIERVRRALMNTDARATGVTLDKTDVHELLRLARLATEGAQ